MNFRRMQKKKCYKKKPFEDVKLAEKLKLVATTRSQQHLTQEEGKRAEQISLSLCVCLSSTHA